MSNNEMDLELLATGQLRLAGMLLNSIKDKPYGHRSVITLDFQSDETVEIIRFMVNRIKRKAMKITMAEVYK